MSTYTYPLARPSGTLTAAQIHAILANPRIIGRRMADLTDQKFIADFLLQGRFQAAGGGVFYRSNEGFGVTGAAGVNPGSEYPKIIVDEGDITAAATTKTGISTVITDEKIAREGQTVLDNGLQRLANSVIQQVDTVAMAVVTSKITDEVASAANWTTTKTIIAGALKARANRDALKRGINLDTVLLNGDDYATVMSIFLDSGLLPKDTVGANAILTGEIPANLLGFTWVTSPQFSGSNPLAIDREQLGGMADEDLGGPGWVRAGETGVEVKAVRKDDTDSYEPIARRSTVPIVVEPKAGVAITGTGL